MSLIDPTEISNMERVELDIDDRLEKAREELFREYAIAPEGISLEFIAGLIRAAWGQGLMDGLREPEQWQNWLKSHGYDEKGRCVDKSS